MSFPQTQTLKGTAGLLPQIFSLLFPSLKNTGAAIASCVIDRFRPPCRLVAVPIQLGQLLSTKVYSLIAAHVDLITTPCRLQPYRDCIAGRIQRYFGRMRTGPGEWRRVHQLRGAPVPELIGSHGGYLKSVVSMCPNDDRPDRRVYRPSPPQAERHSRETAVRRKRI